ncbi:hypothetical protein Ddye_007736 [Dipteronia dyeriana]|uniref:Uncharacterized protein n=1 Tax=Dipteronia dyeriana TaxID=168575 RepID=A0AAD9XKY7_9ROSI|nr:hypothetical protein Ddye_007736 [Dipteronia dyeriana]
MVCFNVSTKFLGVQIEYGVDDPENYTLGALWANVYTITHEKDVDEEVNTKNWLFIGLDGCHLKGKSPGVLMVDVVDDANFEKAVKNSNKPEFVEVMNQLKDANMDAYNWVMKIDAKHWSRHAFDEQVKSNHVTNNITKKINGWIDRFRGQPLLTMFENLRRKMMKCMSKRLQYASKGKYGWREGESGRERDGRRAPIPSLVGEIREGKGEEEGALLLPGPQKTIPPMMGG